MDHKTYQPKMPDIVEAIFDAIYLLFDLVAGIVFFAMAQGRPLFVLYGQARIFLRQRKGSGKNHQ